MQHPKSGLDGLILEVSRSHNWTHAQPIGLLPTRDQLVTQGATYTKSNKHNRRTSIPSVGSETAIPAVDRPQNYAFDRMASGIGNINVTARY